MIFEHRFHLMTNTEKVKMTLKSNHKADRKHPQPSLTPLFFLRKMAIVF